MATAYSRRMTDEQKAQARRMAAEGMGPTRIAAALGFTAGGITRWAKTEGVDLPSNKKTKGPRRVAALKMLSEGQRRVDVARSLGVAQTAVTAWLRRAAEENGAAFHDGRKTRWQA